MKLPIEAQFYLVLLDLYSHHRTNVTFDRFVQFPMSKLTMSDVLIIQLFCADTYLLSYVIYILLDSAHLTHSGLIAT